MVQLFAKYSWSFVARGVFAVLFGLMLILRGGSSLDFLVLSFGIFALLQGIFSGIPGLSKLDGRIYFLLIEGVIGILVGVLTFLFPGIGRMLWPDVATKTLLVFIASWAFITGIAEMIGSFRLAGEMKGKWVITLSGWVALLLGLILLLRSEAGATGNGLLIGLFGIVFGLLWVFVGLKARNVHT